MQETWEAGSIPGSGISPVEGNGTPLQYSCLENSMNRGVWRAIVHGVAKSQTWLSNLTRSLDFSFSLVLVTDQWNGLWLEKTEEGEILLVFWWEIKRKLLHHWLICKWPRELISHWVLFDDRFVICSLVLVFSIGRPVEHVLDLKGESSMF